MKTPMTIDGEEIKELSTGIAVPYSMAYLTTRQAGKLLAKFLGKKRVVPGGTWAIRGRKELVTVTGEGYTGWRNDIIIAADGEVSITR